MKLFSLPLIFVGCLAVSSCGLLNTAVQLPLRTLQSLGRTIGLEHTEVEGEQAEVKFEVKEGR